MKLAKLLLLLLTALLATQATNAQRIYKYENNDVKFLFFDKKISQYVPHLIWEHQLGLERHNRIWNAGDTAHQYRPEQTLIYLTDWNDDGNGGASILPNNMISIRMAPLQNSYNFSPSVERYRHLFSHELTHIFCTDRYTQADRRWRRLFGAKVPPTSTAPISTFWSYLSAPRWYNPRWFQEGIACLMETAMNGGAGRTLGSYDEMYFRTQVLGNKELYSAVGLETEGTSADFQVGTTSYLYGTRFVSYLTYKYGTEKLTNLYNRTEGSKRFFGSQFRKVYGKSYNTAWNEWRQFEQEHQQQNIEAINEYPLTPLIPLTNKALGSVCPPIYVAAQNRLYLAQNSQGSIAHISYIDLATGKEKKLRNIDGSMLFLTTFMTYDSRRNRLLYTIHNNDFRGIEAIDASSGKPLQRLTLQRVNNLSYCNATDCLYGIMSNAGVNHLIRYSADLKERTILFSFTFGQSVSDLDVSNDGKLLLAKLTKPNGNDALITFVISNLEKGVFHYNEIKEIDGVSFTNFRFADGDSTIVGSSDYTGVPNIWQIQLDTKEMELLTNVESGLLAPTCCGADSLIALHYEPGGMRPVRFARQPIRDANSVTLLGQQAFDAHPQLTEWGKDQASPTENYADIYNQITEYKPIGEIRFAGAYPDITGFRDAKAANQVTPVLGYQIQFQDPLGLSTLQMSLGVSPWSNNELRHQFHANLSWRYWNWTFTAAYNPTCFYDLAGPLQRSRQGYNVGVQYQRQWQMQEPKKYGFSVAANTYGMMAALPIYQEIASPVSSMQTLQATAWLQKTRSSLGAIAAEQGYKLNLSAYSYFAKVDDSYQAFPQLSMQADVGFRLPVGMHNSLWLRSAVGQSFASTNSAFGYQFFGGFRNNYIDNGTILRYREENAFPGAEIDEIPAHSYTKLMGELNLSPIRLKHAGTAGLYANYVFMSLFASDLIANPWGNLSSENYINVGAQLNVEMVLFSYMKTTWSVGFARLFAPNNRRSNELMLSVKLL